MMRFNRCRLGLAVALGALALAANAQPAANSQGQTAPATRSATGTSAAKSGQAAKPATTHATKRRATTHRTPNMGRANRANVASESNMPDSAYKAALRRCVTGPESARDQCLDQAIAQYGHA